MQAQPGAAQHQQQYNAFGAFAQAPRQQQAGWQPQAAQQPALGLQGQAYPVQQQPPPLGGFQQGLGPQALFGALSSGLQQGGPIAGPGRSAGPVRFANPCMLPYVPTPCTGHDNPDPGISHLDKYMVCRVEEQPPRSRLPTHRSTPQLHPLCPLAPRIRLRTLRRSRAQEKASFS